MTDNDAIRSHLEMLSDDELAAILLDRDEDQWHPEVFDIVAAILESRGVSTRELIARAEADSEKEEESAAFPQNLRVVAKYLDPLEAHADRLALEQSGLKAWVTGEGDSAEGIGSELKVRPEDWAAAMDLLEAPPVSPSEMAAESGVQCPRCGSRDVDEEEEDLEVLDAAASSLSSSRRQMWLYRCAQCKHAWPA